MPPSTSNDDLTSPSILLVDDVRANLLALEAVLEPLGYNIATACSGEEALKLVVAQDFALILMDVHMAGLDGYQTTALIRDRERSRDVPVIFLTAVYNQPEHSRRGYALGAVDYISKPFDPDVLRAKVGVLVSLYTRGQRSERKRSQEAERTKDLFLGAIGHDLRNPLSTILIASHQMARGENLDEAHRRFARRIERAGTRMQRMIEDILDLTQGRLADGIQLTRTQTDLGQVCRGVLDEYRLAHPERAFELSVTGNVCGCWDPDRLGRVAANLISNAVQHGAEEPVRVNVREEGDSVVLAVHNLGAPIPEEELPTLFEPFRRGETTARGLGLGLYIVRELVLAHHGAIDVTSTMTGGTVFEITLPREAASSV